MLDIKLIQENPQKLSALYKNKGHDIDFTELLSWDEKRREAISQVEKFKAQKNKVSAEIPKLKKAGQPVDEIFAEMKKTW